METCLYKLDRIYYCSGTEEVYIICIHQCLIQDYKCRGAATIYTLIRNLGNVVSMYSCIYLCIGADAFSSTHEERLAELTALAELAQRFAFQKLL